MYFGGWGFVGLGVFFAVIYLCLKQGWTKKSIPSRQEIRNYAFKTEVYIQIFVCMLPKLPFNEGVFLEMLLAFKWQCVLENPLFPKENPGFKNYFINLNLLFIQLGNIRVTLVSWWWIAVMNNGPSKLQIYFYV